MRTLAGILLLLGLAASPAWAQDQGQKSIEEQVRDLLTFDGCSVLWSETVEGGLKMVMHAPDQSTIYDLLFEIGASPLFKKPEILYAKTQDDGVRFEWTVRFTDKMEDAALREEELGRLRAKLLAVVGG
ncbi:MAG: hypothetical protein ACM3L6_03690 [Deltaproteobacteria bacterium]